MKRYEIISAKGKKDIDEYNVKTKNKLRHVTMIIEEYAQLKL
jgi:DNA segregation ATPase FtsK/SpoIIIE-like protein